MENLSFEISSPSFLIIVSLLGFMIFILGIWFIVYLVREFSSQSTNNVGPSDPAKTFSELSSESNSPQVSNPLVPVYLYGFAPGPTPREISSSNGLLTAEGSSLKINKPQGGSTENSAENSVKNSQNQQWYLIKDGSGVKIQNASNLKYIGSQGKLVDQGISWDLVGPLREGRSYYIRNGNLYLITKSDMTVEASEFKTPPLNAEWMIVLSSTQ